MIGETWEPSFCFKGTEGVLWTDLDGAGTWPDEECFWKVTFTSLCLTVNTSQKCIMLYLYSKSPTYEWASFWEYVYKSNLFVSPIKLA